MSIYSIGGLLLGIVAIGLQFVGDGLMAKGQEEEFMADLEKKYVLVPRNKEDVQKSKKKKK